MRSTTTPQHDARADRGGREDGRGGAPRIMVHVVAYNAAATLASVLDRIPRDLYERLTEICVFDDASKDGTFLVAEGYKAVRDMARLRVFQNKANRGYGGNQKLGYRYAIDHGFDYVVLLHGDGQYAPEVMPSLLQPALAGEADAVFGSRMMTPGAARRGGMPLYKYVGNKILSRVENALLGMDLSEFHSGYRVYSVKALSQIPFEKNSDDFHFDTQIIIQLKVAGFRIREVPIPTYYGDEISRVNGVKYAKDVVKSVLEFRLHEAGLASRPEYAHSPVQRYEQKASAFASHNRIIEAVRPGARVLDVGCAGGYLARALRDKGCTVIGVDAQPGPDAAASCDRLYVADLDGGASGAGVASVEWSPEERGFDYIIFGDILEHLRDPAILGRCRGWLAPGGRVIASTGNVALWYVRLSLLLGRFDYGRRGILDESHVHLYTRESFLDLLRRSGFRVLTEDVTVIPMEALLAGFLGERGPGAVGRVVDSLSYELARLWPGALAYQFVVQAEPEDGAT